MLTLINTNRMTPPIAPLALDYLAGTARAAAITVDVLDLCLTDQPNEALRDYLTNHNPQLIGLSFRNVDDCFWPSAAWFVPQLADLVHQIRQFSDAAIVIGGVGFSLFAEQIVQLTGADFGICGDGEQALAQLYHQLLGARQFDRIAGLIWRHNGKFYRNSPARCSPLMLPTTRDAVDNQTYFRAGGQCGLETKRGCNRPCIYCADPLAKGCTLRLRNPAEVADEAEALLRQGIDVLHLCDSEFNIPRHHAVAVCQEFIRRSLGRRIRWYTYCAVTPFDAELASLMRRAGCVGIDFTGDSADPSMLRTYQQPHSPEELATAVRLCKENQIAVMVDLLFGGPGETPESVHRTIRHIRQIEPDCAGAAVGIRIYPATRLMSLIQQHGPLEQNPNLRRNYTGPIDLLQPTFYISKDLGPRPAALVKQMIASDQRFFEPTEEPSAVQPSTQPSTDHNYNDNRQLVEAIKAGYRGAYWDILRKLKQR